MTKMFRYDWSRFDAKMGLIFMVAWCLVYWYLLAPLFLGDKELGSVLLGHVVGAGLVIALNLLKPIWSRATDKAAPED